MMMFCYTLLLDCGTGSEIELELKITVMASPTIRDVAKLAGVGIGTVSRVLNGSPQVREETRQKVLAAIQELKFSPNVVARQLSSGRSLTIGVATPFFTFPSFVDRLSGIQDVLNESDYDLILYSVSSLSQFEWQLNTLIGQSRVDGLIVLSIRFSEAQVQAINPEFPIVVVDNDRVQHYPNISIDDIAGGELATNYLIERGHQSIGFIGDRISTFGFAPSRRRFIGFKRALRKADLPLNLDWVWCGEHSSEAARQAAREILQLPDRPTAIFATIDTLGFGVLAAAQDLGLQVPGDVAVIGFDDIQAASYVGLTTVNQHLSESGQLGASRMLEWLTQGTLATENWYTQLDLEIVERATV